MQGCSLEDGYRVRRDRRADTLSRLQGKASSHAVVLAVAGCVLSLSGIFLMRFVFYMLHLTYGLGL